MTKAILSNRNSGAHFTPARHQTDDQECELEPRAFRDVIGHYASGITIVAGHDGEEPLGFTCQSFYSVSVSPPLISFSVMATSSTYPRIRKLGTFSVNILSAAQQAISDQFASKRKDRWAGIDWEVTPGRNPKIVGALTWIDCQIVAEYQAGDHYIVIGQVLAMSPANSSECAPLLYFKGKYRELHNIDEPAG